MNQYGLFKKYIAFSLSILLMVTLSIPVNADTSDIADDSQFMNYVYAQRLKEIGVFVGDEGGFELYREPTRLESLIVLMRLLGLESTAIQTYDGTCPFDDVPDWGKPYVAYAYEHGLTSGVGNNKFGTDQLIKSHSFMTFMLRALGYDDNQGDFLWEEANQFAYDIGVIDDETLYRIENEVFIRDHVAGIVFQTLLTQVRESEATLAMVLIDSGAIEHETARQIDVVPDVEEPTVDETDNASDNASDESSEVDSNGDSDESTESDAEDAQNGGSDSDNITKVKDQEFVLTEPVVQGDGITLLGQPTASRETVAEWARSKGMIEEGIELIDIYYEICEVKGINPVIQYVQMCIETGYLYKVPSQAGLDTSWHNPCGLKIPEGGDNFDAHAHYVFDNWYDGIDAHTDHTALYAGLEGYPKADSLDPRHFGWLLGSGDTIELMARRWVGKTEENDDGVYASKIIRLYNEILELELTK
jgi:hypothetical protein